MHNKLTPEMLERLLSEYPEALNGDIGPFVGVHERAALHELAEIAHHLEAALVPVSPRVGFVRDLKHALTATSAEAQSTGWTRTHSVKMAGAFALSAGLWYVVWPKLVAWRSRGSSDIPTQLNAPGVVDAAS